MEFGPDLLLQKINEAQRDLGPALQSRAGRHGGTTGRPTIAQLKQILD